MQHTHAMILSPRLTATLHRHTYTVRLPSRPYSMAHSRWRGSFLFFELLYYRVDSIAVSFDFNCGCIVPPFLRTLSATRAQTDLHRVDGHVE